MTSCDKNFIGADVCIFVKVLCVSIIIMTCTCKAFGHAYKLKTHGLTCYRYSTIQTHEYYLKRKQNDNNLWSSQKHVACCSIGQLLVKLSMNIH